MPTVPLWSGREVRALREARRMSVREFAAHLGVSDRMELIQLVTRDIEQTTT